jgi:hypothetical protein
MSDSEEVLDLMDDDDESEGYGSDSPPPKKKVRSHYGLYLLESSWIQRELSKGNPRKPGSLSLPSVPLVALPTAGRCYHMNIA